MVPAILFSPLEPLSWSRSSLAGSFFCSALSRQTLLLCCRPTSLNQPAGWSSQLPAVSVRKSRIAVICNGSCGLSLAQSPSPSAHKPLLSALFIFTRVGTRSLSSSVSDWFWDQSPPGAAALFRERSLIAFSTSLAASSVARPLLAPGRRPPLL